MSVQGSSPAFRTINHKVIPMGGSNDGISSRSALPKSEKNNNDHKEKHSSRREKFAKNRALSFSGKIAKFAGKKIISGTRTGINIGKAKHLQKQVEQGERKIDLDNQFDEILGNPNITPEVKFRQLVRFGVTNKKDLSKHQIIELNQTLQGLDLKHKITNQNGSYVAKKPKPQPVESTPPPIQSESAPAPAPEPKPEPTEFTTPPTVSHSPFPPESEQQQQPTEQTNVPTPEPEQQSSSDITSIDTDDVPESVKAHIAVEKSRG